MEIFEMLLKYPLLIGNKNLHSPNNTFCNPVLKIGNINVRQFPGFPCLQYDLAYKMSCSCWPFSKQAQFFTCVYYKSFENTMGKGEIARIEQFFLFPQCFLLFSKTFRYFHQIWNCRLQTLSIRKSLKFVV